MLAGRYFDEISQDTGKYCFGVEDTLRALELGSVETLICWENLDIQRYVLKNHGAGEEKILHLTPEQEKDKTHFTDKEVRLVLLVLNSNLSRSCNFEVNFLLFYFPERSRVGISRMSTLIRMVSEQLQKFWRNA